MCLRRKGAGGSARPRNNSKGSAGSAHALCGATLGAGLRLESRLASPSHHTALVMERAVSAGSSQLNQSFVRNISD
jgi:hypothetical protein